MTTTFNSEDFSPKGEVTHEGFEVWTDNNGNSTLFMFEHPDGGFKVWSNGVVVGNVLGFDE